MKATVEGVIVDSLAPFELPEVSVKFTVSEWQLVRELIRMAREHMDVMETDLSDSYRQIYKRMIPIFIEIDGNISSSLEKIVSEHKDVNIDIVKDFHRFDWTQELNSNTEAVEGEEQNV